MENDACRIRKVETRFGTRARKRSRERHMRFLTASFRLGIKARPSRRSGDGQCATVFGEKANSQRHMLVAIHDFLLQKSQVIPLDRFPSSEGKNKIFRAINQQSLTPRSNYFFISKISLEIIEIGINFQLQTIVYMCICIFVIVTTLE